MATLTTLRQRCARELGTFLSGTADNTSDTSTLYDLTWPVYSSLDQSTLYQDMWLFRPGAAASADKVRIISTYTPASGSLTPDKGWTNAAGGESYEIHGVIEPATQLLRLMNQALRRCFIVTEFTIAAISQQNRHSLSTQSWLNNPYWVRQVGYLTTSEDRNQNDPYTRAIRGQAIQDGSGTLNIEHPWQTFNGNETLYIRVIKPLYHQCAASGGTAGTQDGLSLETDTCPIQEDWLAAATLVEAWREYDHVLEPNANQRLIRNRAEAAAWFSDLTARYFQPPEPLFRPLERYGPWTRQFGPVW